MDYHSFLSELQRWNKGEKMLTAVTALVTYIQKQYDTLIRNMHTGSLLKLIVYASLSAAPAPGLLPLLVSSPCSCKHCFATAHVDVVASWSN